VRPRPVIGRRPEAEPAVAWREATRRPSREARAGEAAAPIAAVRRAEPAQSAQANGPAVVPTVVTVTIGRLEIRTQSRHDPGTSRRSAGPARPLIGPALDEYLRGGRGGGRP
jgi:hypothetical protein